MPTVLPAKSYFDPEVFLLEKSHVFEKEWLFVGMCNEIPNQRDWITVELLGRSIIIYNTGKEIKAFQNVCPHRFNKIFPETQGNSPIVCKYHMWGFSEEGILLGKKEVYPEPEEKICLKAYNVDIAGNFIFIHFSSQPQQKLSEQLGDEISEQLKKISPILGSKIGERNIPHVCNWKFIVENVIDNHHCLAVHKNTLVNIGYCKVQPSEHNQNGNNSNFVIPSHDVSIAKKRTMIAKYFFEKEFINDYYKHTLIYPNLVIGNTEGANFNFGTILPLNESESILNLKFFQVKTKNIDENAYEDYKRICLDFAVSVFMEDKAILDTLQSGVKEIEHSGFQYHSEKRVEWFTDSYNKSIENGIS